MDDEAAANDGGIGVEPDHDLVADGRDVARDFAAAQTTSEEHKAGIVD